VPRDLDHLQTGIETIRTAAAAGGRDPASIGVATSGGARSLDELLALLPRLERLGVTIVNLPALFWTRTIAEAIDLMHAFAERAGITDEHR
jgi:hypothetical protein